MKRSEMIDIICKLLIIHENNKGIKGSCEARACTILIDIEKKGMLPPDFHFDIEDKSVTRVHEWEPEDE